MAPLVAKESINQETSHASEKTIRNKRKFRADTPADQSESFSSDLDELPPYDYSSEKSGAMHHGQNVACGICGCNQDHSSELSDHESTEPSELCPLDATHEFDSGDFKDDDWNELTEAQLEDLLLSYLGTTLTSAIKKIVAYGYPEEVATKSIMRTGISHGLKDAMSNIVENAIKFLTTSQHTDGSKDSLFDDLQQLGIYILAEMVCVLRALRPTVSTGDAMWYLLICDMNISQACTMDDETSTSNNTVNGGSPNENSSTAAVNRPDTAVKTSELGSPDTCRSIASTPPLPSEIVSKSRAPATKVTSSEKNNSDTEFVAKASHISGSSQKLATDGKTNSSRKVHLSTSLKRELLPAHKALHLDKGSRATGYKGGLKPGKISKLAGASFDRKLKCMAQFSATHNRNGSSKLSKAFGFKVHQEPERLKPTDDQPNTVEDFRLDSDNSKIPVLASSILYPPPLPTENDPASIPVPETELSLCLLGTKNSQEPAGSNIDDSLLRKPFPQFSGPDAKDLVNIMLAPKVHELQSELKEWTDWANQKIMQAARRLGKDKAELKSLRQEREEAEKLKRDKQTMDENNMKKLSEMENALRKAIGKVERAKSAFRGLEMMNAALKQQMEAAKFRSAESANSCSEASAREMKTFMELQSCEKQKNLFQDELVNEKRKFVHIQKELLLAKDITVKVEAKLEKIIKVKDNFIVEASSTRKQIEHAVAMAKSKEEVTKLKAENSLQKYRDDIKSLEREISELRLNEDSSKIAALRLGINEGYKSKQTDMLNDSLAGKDLLAPKVTPWHLSRLASVKRNRECVMCLSEEMSVVFLPCAHQVVCSKCNELHGKKGMKECPSCRSLIERRIVVLYAVS